MNFQPLKDRLVIQIDAVTEKQLDSGIILRKEDQEAPQEGLVLAIGPEVKDVAVNDRVMFNKYDGQKQSIEGVDVRIMKENQIWGVLGYA